MKFHIQNFCKFVNECDNYKKWNDTVRTLIKQNQNIIFSRKFYGSYETNLSLREYCEDTINRMVNKFVSQRSDIITEFPSEEVKKILTDNLCRYLGVG